jgi:RNA polymerase sigma factor (sigma-70 family)
MNEGDPYELLLALRGRDTTAVARVYDAFGRRAYSLAYRICGDHGTAEEAVQDAFVDLWQNAERLDPNRGNLQSLLLTVVRFKSIDKLRKRRGQPGLNDAMDIDLIQDWHTDGNDAATNVLDKDFVQSVLSALPAEQSRCVELASFGGYTHVEIASIMNVPLGTVKSRLRLALERLRTVLREREPSELPGS